MKKKKSSQKHAVAESDLMHTFTASRERDQKKITIQNWPPQLLFQSLGDLKLFM